MSATEHPERLVSITGVGQSAVGRPVPFSPLKLTVDACIAAIADAGLTPADIDGLATYPGAHNTGDGYSPIGAVETVAALGLNPTWMSASIEGHSHMGAVAHAIHAIASGACRHVLIFRTVAQASARARVHHAGVLGGGDTEARVWGWQQWSVPFGALSTATLFALYAQGYRDKFGLTDEQLGAIAVNGRKMAGLNPNAVYRKPITIEDYLAGRMISTPLRIFDCDAFVDGSTAIVLSRNDVAADMRQPPLDFEAFALGMNPIGMGAYVGDFSHMGINDVGEAIWSKTDLKPKDMKFAQLYDGFSIHVLMWLEALQLCGHGEAASFVEGGARIGLGGELPLNTSGGQLSAGRFHGFGHIYEACLQLWGRAGERQIRDADVGIVSNGGFGVGAFVLRRRD